MPGADVGTIVDKVGKEIRHFLLVAFYFLISGSWWGEEGGKWFRKKEKM